MSAVPKVEIDPEMQKSLDYCDKLIEEGELQRDFFTMVKLSLESGESKWEEWQNEAEEKSDER